MVVLNPFASTVDLTTADGKKSYKHATEGSRKKYDLNNDSMNAENFKLEIEEACKKFCWAIAIDNLPISWDENGDPDVVVNVMKDFRDITEREMIAATGTRFDCTFDANEKFHDFTIRDTADDDENKGRIMNVMIGQWLINSLTENGKKSIQNDAHKFEYKNTDNSIVNDGAIILLLILQKIMPTTKVGVNTKKLKLMSTDPAEYEQDIAKTITAMQTLKTSIEAESKKSYDDFELHLFNACVKSTNTSFREYAEGLMDDWETDSAGAPKDESEIVNRLLTKWNNLCAAKPTKPNAKAPKVEEKAQYLALFTALTTSVKGLSERVQSLQKSNGSNRSGVDQSNGNRNGGSSKDIAEWRRSKTLGDEVVKDGKQYYWCPQHQNGAGLYVTHHPLDHGKRPIEWQHTR